MNAVVFEIETSQKIAARTSALTYRPDVDGLRAMAILGVVLYHAFPGIFPGGFAGVDVFFVISGYLITGIISSELTRGQFSIVNFYAKRIRRIFPALMTVLFSTFLMGWFCLYADEFKQLGKHIVAGIAFVSNWTLWSEAGYFDQSAATKPLLHLWSLGVEEQFYILWPLFLAVGFRRGWTRAIVVICAVLSFMANVWLVNAHPSAAFFLPFSRFWELLCGAALARWSQSGEGDNALSGLSQRMRNLLSILGLTTCVVSFFALDSRLNFPGWWALLPTSGACMCIAAGVEAAGNRWILSNPVSIGIGKISYPLYLWHWPLLSFGVIVAGSELVPAARVEILLASVALAWLTLQLVERPFQRARSRWISVAAPAVLLLIAGYLGAMTYARDGLEFRLKGKGYSASADPASATLGAGRQYVDRVCGVGAKDQKLFDFCSTDKRATPRYAMWGDSKADAAYWGLVRHSQPGESWLLIARAGCAPTVSAEGVPTAGIGQARCTEATATALRMLVNNSEIGTVVLTMAARDLLAPPSPDQHAPRTEPSDALAGVDNLVKVLMRAGKRVAFVIDTPTLAEPHQCMDRRPAAWEPVRSFLHIDDDVSANDRCAISYHAHLQATRAYRALVAQLQKRNPDLLVYDPTPLLCDIRHDTCPMTVNGSFLYSYSDHISDYANGLIAPQLSHLLGH
ncbi:acyltransferase family protein [Paraburkholderia sp. J94]|uniref:acyltransferase family protein n=1 Tax=Paraburkholderia sp. J94 TaxID=2805441 RepID=UPI002AB03DED|nr:acyltransferase family protein [Paraburkholderia sp. J94]